jgi:putative NADPH-quinone reductase
MPAVLKNYIDKVFTRGFAHGPDGDKLKNKKLLMCITCGGVESSYKEGGYNAYSFNDFLKPINLIFKTAQMNILEPLVIFGCNPTIGDYNLSTEINLFINEYKKAIINL